MKKISYLLLAIVMLFSAPVAFAKPGDTPSDGLKKMYTVSSDLSTTEDNLFDWNETPFLYIELKDDIASDKYANIFTDWSFGSIKYADLDLTNQQTGENSSKKKFWLSPTNWDDIRVSGVWDVLGNIEYRKDSDNSLTKTGSLSYQFTVNAAPVVTTVTPEPASMLLFGIGAGALGLSRTRRKKI